MIGQMLGSLSQMAAAAFSAITQGLSAAADAIRGAWSGLFDWFGGKIEGLTQWFTQLISRVRELSGWQAKRRRKAAVRDLPAAGRCAAPAAAQAIPSRLGCRPVSS